MKQFEPKRKGSVRERPSVPSLAAAAAQSHRGGRLRVRAGEALHASRPLRTPSVSRAHPPRSGSRSPRRGRRDLCSGARAVLRPANTLFEIKMEIILSTLPQVLQLLACFHGDGSRAGSCCRALQTPAHFWRTTRERARAVPHTPPRCDEPSGPSASLKLKYSSFSKGNGWEHAFNTLSRFLLPHEDSSQHTAGSDGWPCGKKLTTSTVLGTPSPLQMLLGCPGALQHSSSLRPG